MEPLRFRHKLPAEQRNLLARLEQESAGGSQGFEYFCEGDRVFYKHVSPAMIREGDNLLPLADLQGLAVAGFVEIGPKIFFLK